MKVNGKDDIPYIMENKKCLKPPTRYIYIYNYINPLKMVIFAINGNYQKDMTTYMVIQGKFMGCVPGN
jgi:hypothetical protein